MSAIKRFFWLATLVIFSGGCSSYRVVSSPNIEDETEMAVGWESSIKVGDEVRITLTDNGELEGKIMAISPNDLTLEPLKSDKWIKGNKYIKDPENLSSDYRPRVVEADSIRVLEKWSVNKGKSWLLVGGILVGTVSVAAATADWSMDSPSLGQ